MKEGFRPQAERQVKLRLALERSPPWRELKAGVGGSESRSIRRSPEQYKMEADKIRELIPAAELGKRISAWEKAINFGARQREY